MLTRGAEQAISWNIMLNFRLLALCSLGGVYCESPYSASVNISINSMCFSSAAGLSALSWRLGFRLSNLQHQHSCQIWVNGNADKIDDCRNCLTESIFCSEVMRYDRNVRSALQTLVYIYTASQKTRHPIVKTILSNLNRFSKFFHCCSGNLLNFQQNSI